MSYAQTMERETLGRRLSELHTAGYTSAELGKQFHMTAGAVRGLIRTARLKQTPAEFNVIHLGEQLQLTGDFIIVGDVHVPATDWQFAQLVGGLRLSGQRRETCTPPHVGQAGAGIITGRPRRFLIFNPGL